MGRIAQLLSFVRSTANGTKTSNVTVDRGGGDNRTPQHFSSPGDDAFPLQDDYVQLVSQAGTGRNSAVGYIDPSNDQKARVGEKRIYARDIGGASIVELWLKNDGEAALSNDQGTVTLGADGSMAVETPAATFSVAANGSIIGSNGGGSFELSAGGDFVVNGVIIDSAGNLTVPTSLTVNNKELAEHTHSQGNDSGGNTEQDTGPNN